MAGKIVVGRMSTQGHEEATVAEVSDEMTKAELLEEAERRGLSGLSGSTKAEVLAALWDSDDVEAEEEAEGDEEESDEAEEGSGPDPATDLG